MQIFNKKKAWFRPAKKNPCGKYADETHVLVDIYRPFVRIQKISYRILSNAADSNKLIALNWEIYRFSDTVQRVNDHAGAFGVALTENVVKDLVYEMRNKAIGSRLFINSNPEFAIWYAKLILEYLPKITDALERNIDARYAIKTVSKEKKKTR